jgi:DNA excision repair protein ERCC-4
MTLAATVYPHKTAKSQLFILQGLPGVGPERAGRLLDTFGSVEAVISASSSELQSVYGIGKTVADRIKWAVSERIQPYGYLIDKMRYEVLF